MKIADFYAEFKVKGDTLTLRDMAARLGDMKLTTLGEITALGVLGDMFKNVGIHAMDMASNYTTLNKELDISTDMMQRWQNVARATNVPANAVASSFANVQKTLAGFKQGQFNEGFMRGAAFLGLQNAATMTYDQIFEALRSKVPSLVKERGAAFTSNALALMGIDPSMIQMLELSRGQFRQRELSSPIMSSAQLREWTELNNQVAVLRQQLFMLGEEILGVALPQLIKWTQALVDSEGWVKKRFGKAEEAAAAPFIEGHGLMGVYGHAFMSAVAPDLTTRASRQSIVQNNNHKTDIHVHGDNAESIARETARHVERQQRSMVTALQSVNSQQAY